MRLRYPHHRQFYPPHRLDLSTIACYFLRMTDSELENIRAIVRAELADARADVRALRDDVRPMRAHLDGMPMLQRNLTATQQEVRALKAAFNDFALTNPTSGEIEALHHDVNRVQAENAELAVKVATLERLVRELQEAR
jgi:predicted  nucleic acid-binding Zn-ribbon protein